MSAPPLRLGLVTLGVADLDRSIGFYRALGLIASSVSVEGVVCFMPMGAVALALFPRASLAEDATVSPEASGFAGMSLAWNLPGRAEVDAAFERIAAAGGTIVKAARVTDWGGYGGYFNDPDGHLWEVAHNPFWPLDADGRLTLP